MDTVPEANEFALIAILNDYDVQDVAQQFGITESDVQAICGRRGHAMDTIENGDPTTPYYECYRQCIYCGAPDESEGDEP